ncbi:hypothetical protein RAA17_24775 [Komagataeibacter rhaeticus]|nr:hypothetical protein [Komagataeibacter rhaeticus]
MIANQHQACRYFGTIDIRTGRMARRHASLEKGRVNKLIIGRGMFARSLRMSKKTRHEGMVEMKFHCSIPLCNRLARTQKGRTPKYPALRNKNRRLWPEGRRCRCRSFIFIVIKETKRSIDRTVRIKQDVITVVIPGQGKNGPQ